MPHHTIITIFQVIFIIISILYAMDRDLHLGTTVFLFIFTNFTGDSALQAVLSLVPNF